MIQFSQLGLSDSTLAILNQMGFETPTPIQQQAIPYLLSDSASDLIALAQTGTGKTAAFGLPLVELVTSSAQDPQALILAPTRELAQQSADQLLQFTDRKRTPKVEVVYGGAAITMQMKNLKKGADILLATPGRLIDLIKRKAVSLKNIKYLVLDEADEMLNMGFKDEIDKILETVPDNRSIWLFSATMPPEIRKIVNTYMKNPHEVKVNQESKTNQDISHQYIITKTANKLAAARRFLDIHPEMRGIMFCRTKIETQEIADQFSTWGYGVEALHGDLTQSQRTAVMKRFKGRSMQLLIATDVAARGIDVNDLSHVFHHKLPDQVEAYTHRSGRTGRAGKKGISMAFINPRETNKIKQIERALDVTFERVDVPKHDDLISSRMNHWAEIIVNTKIDSRADHVLSEIQSKFSDLSKEDILKRLITTQLDHLMIQEGEDSDLNENNDGSGKSRGRKGFNRYFINMGSMDGLTSGDLIHFIADMAGIERKNFGDVTLQKNYAFFEVNSDSDKGLAAKFDGFILEGRELRVNRDNENPGRSSGGSSNRRPKSGGGGKGRNFSGNHRNGRNPKRGSRRR